MNIIMWRVCTAKCQATGILESLTAHNIAFDGKSFFCSASDKWHIDDMWTRPRPMWIKALVGVFLITTNILFFYPFEANANYNRIFVGQAKTKSILY